MARVETVNRHIRVGERVDCEYAEIVIEDGCVYSIARHGEGIFEGVNASGMAQVRLPYSRTVVETVPRAVKRLKKYRKKGDVW